jgi:hypothetical protein
VIPRAINGDAAWFHTVLELPNILERFPTVPKQPQQP